MSTHAIEIVEIGEVRPHPNADKMNVTEVWGWQCCIGKDQFKSGDRAVYIPPDFLVPLSRPEFSFLRKEGTNKDQERIRVRRLRGQLSQGLLIPAPHEFAEEPIGTDVAEHMGIVRYEPPMPIATSGLFVSGPSGLYAPKFDVENYQRYGRAMFLMNEPVIVTEKIHGANARYTWSKNADGEWAQFCGSRTNWMAEDEKNAWHKAFRGCPSIGAWCRANPERILFGEVFGQVQGLKYGAGRNDVFFAAFAVLDKQRWMDWEEMEASLSVFGVPIVPVVYRGPFNEGAIAAMAEGDSSWPGANHMREGVVVVPKHERTSEEIGRVVLKMVSNRYLES